MIFALGEKKPQLNSPLFIAPNACITGDVTIGQDASVWYSAVLRGDNDSVTLGRECNIQDAAVLHTDVGYPIVLEDRVSVGHSAVVHGCTVGEGTLIGMSATVLSGARIGKNCLIAAGAVVLENAVIPDGSLVVGVPGKVRGPLKPEQLQSIAATPAEYAELARLHAQYVPQSEFEEK